MLSRYFSQEIRPELLEDVGRHGSAQLDAKRISGDGCIPVTGVIPARNRDGAGSPQYSGIVERRSPCIRLRPEYPADGVP